MDQMLNISSNIVSATVGTAYWTLKPFVKLIEKGADVCSSSSPAQIIKETVYSYPPEMKKWIAIAGLMGASAVAIGAYGAHVVYPRKEIADNRKAVFETANKYHFLHSLALLGVPFARKPCLTGSLFLSGTIVFSGTCYYYAMTDNKDVSKWTPYGGATLILAWLSLAL